jgi:hypothetical protein
MRTKVVAVEEEVKRGRPRLTPEQASETGLKRLYRGNSTARLLLDWLASRDRNRTDTHFNRVLAVLSAQDVAPTRAGMREVFRNLEKLGVGRFVVGRRGLPTRFIWTTPLTEVGLTAQVPAKPIKAKGKRRAVGKRGPGRPRKSEKIAA